MTEPEEPQVADLLRRWHAGDRSALDQLVQRNLPFVEAQVRRRLGDALRERAATQDFVQDALLDVLTNVPRFGLHNEVQLRALLARVVENVICDEHERRSARKRGQGRERPLPTDTVLELDLPARAVTRPSEAAQRNERAVWVRLALEFLEPEDRRVILLRQWQELSFEEVGAQLGIAPDAARMRFQRALPKLADMLEQLRTGRLDQALGARG